MRPSRATASRLAATPRRVTGYKRREPDGTVLYDVLHEDLESFLSLANASHAGGFPRFVQRELREFLPCGILAKGFACFRCTACGHDRTLGEYLVHNRVYQLALNEPQKFGYVTYFWNGNRSGMFDPRHRSQREATDARERRRHDAPTPRSSRAGRVRTRSVEDLTETASAGHSND